MYACTFHCSAYCQVCFYIRRHSGKCLQLIGQVAYVYTYTDQNQGMDYYLKKDVKIVNLVEIFLRHCVTD